MDRYVGFFRFYTESNLERTQLFATQAEAQTAVVDRMNSDPRIKEGYVVRILSKSDRETTITTTNYGP